jgi:hypothetical protein
MILKYFLKEDLSNLETDKYGLPVLETDNILGTQKEIYEVYTNNLT